MSEYVIAMYLRLSRDDTITNSLSIPNQRALLNKYIEQMDIRGTRILEFADNGYSGTNFERPAVQEMLELVRNGGIQCILCKDFSRFGRNIIETGYFIEQVFPLYGIRFIAVNDRYDSNDYIGDTGGIDVAFKFLIHEYYSKDLSKKIKSAKHIKMVRGESITKNAIYGYQKSDDGKWEIDEDAAGVIRLIFSMALEGKDTAQIRNALCAARHPIPIEYKLIKRGCQIIPSCLWTTTMVSAILQNEKYIGTYIAGKSIRKEVGTSRGASVDESEWIKLPNRHPEIICKDEFDLIQKKFTKKKHTKPKKVREYLLSGKIMCGCCRRALVYGGTKNSVYSCTRTYADPSAECHKFKISAGELDEAVLNIIKTQSQVILNIGDISELHKISADIHKFSDCEKQINQFLIQIQKCYEQFILHEINREAFLSLKNDYTSKIDKLKNQLSIIKQAEHNKRLNNKNINFVKECLNESANHREIVEALIDKIFVYPSNKIEIIWKATDFAVME